MYFANCYRCDNCGDEIELNVDQDEMGSCRSCRLGTYRKNGESYDQEWIDEQKYNQQQDKEYEERHRHDSY